MKLYIKCFLFTCVILAMTSCNKLLDVNTDPNAFPDVPNYLILPSPQVQLAYTLGGEISRITGNIVQHYAGHRNQPLEYGQYDISPAASDGLWESLYTVVLRDLKAVTDKSRVTGDSIYVGISQILTAQTYSVLTDLFGDIPFSASLQDDENITPSYDTQEQIYPALIAMIDAGIANVSSNKGRVPSGDDLVYGGNVGKWVKYANSLKLRLLNHLSKRQPTAALTFLNTNPDLINTNSDNAILKFGTLESNANPIYGFDELSGRFDNAVATTIVNKMKGLSDPRIPLYFNPVLDNEDGLQGQILGNVPGGNNDDAGRSKYSRVGEFYASTNSAVTFITYSEVQFIIAEIRLRAGQTAPATTAYNQAIKADMDTMKVSAAASNAYLLRTDVAFNGTLQRIIEQKYLTMYQANYEAWVDWRRTGFPALTPAAINRTNNVIPRKLTYPQKEINLNKASLEAGPGVPVIYESLKDRVWWDVQ